MLWTPVASSSVQALWLGILALASATARAAEPSSVEQRAREDLDRQLQALVKTPPPEIVITYEGLPGAGGARAYKLLEVDFILNGQPLAVPGLDVLSGPGVHRLAALKVDEGSYTLVSRVTYTNNDTWNLFSEESGFLWKMTASVTFQAQKGLRMKVRVLPGINPTAPDPRLKLKLNHDVSAEMTAQLADASLVEDAGTPAVVARAPVTLPLPPPPVTPPPTTQPLAMAPPPVATPELGPVAPGKLLLKVLSGKKPVEATAYVRGKGAPQQVILEKSAKKPVPVMLPPGEYTVDVLSKGFLAQTRQVKVTREREATVSFTLTKAPAKKTAQASVKNERVELPKPPRFAEKQAAPRKGSTGDIALLVDMLVRDESLKLRLEGHTDNREAPATARQALSEARAKALADALVREGLNPTRIETAGLGDTRPKAPNLIPRGRELNRRVDIVLVRGK
ncbi:OmpA family protein [Myxococcus sp. MISCRS1]|uniref:OmpA family protein n=1 Tax=unclassified Myxococcus TaxID=2648731 RepID=UPI001CC1159A|nr:MULTISPECIES: OmpA family protein [unclassified Myxococcus]MBZ4399406.1 OmpA family protein [Myxococcus sp. AS-1-15]MCY0995822.1 OmpA family protein [Myxococcus sp. MISCRS1]BDT34195.1 OmpA family protein [Myxococcus sp. MH1]